MKFIGMRTSGVAEGEESLEFTWIWMAWVCIVAHVSVPCVRACVWVAVFAVMVVTMSARMNVHVTHTTSA